MSTESLARSATETRIVKVLVSCRACESVRATHTIAKGRDTANGKPDRGSGCLSHKPRGVKAIESAPARIRIGQVLRQSSQGAVGSDEFLAAKNFLRCDLAADDARIAPEQSFDLMLAFLRFQRANAIDERSARAEELDRAVKQPLLQRREHRQISFALEPRYVRVTSYRAGG